MERLLGLGTLTNSTFPRLCLWHRQCRGFVGRGERDGFIRTPRMRLAIDVKRPRKQFDFVPEEIERHRAGQVGKIFKFKFAERNRFLREIKNDRALEVRPRLAEEDNLEVRDIQFRLVDDDRRSAGGLGHERNLPRPAPGPQMLIQREATGINCHRQEQSDQNRFREATRLHFGSQGFASGPLKSSGSGPEILLSGEYE